MRHDDVLDESGALAAMALTSSKISYKSTIFYGRGIAAGQESEANTEEQTAAGDKARGNVKVHGLGERRSDCILDVRITNTDVKSYHNQTSEKVLERAAKAKNDKYLQPCLDRRRSFVPLVYLVASREATRFS